jgi:hypothetical protein
MDFKSLISKLDSMEAPPKTPAAPTLQQAVQLNEDAQLRVLSGRTSYIQEAKKKAEDDVKEEMKVGDKKASSTGGTIEKTATGVKHSAGKNYGGDKAPKDDDSDDEPKAKKAKKESIEPQFKSKFMKMVEAKKEEAADKKKKMAKKEKMEEGSKPDFLDLDKDGDKKEPMKKAADDKGDDKPAGKKGMSDKQAKYFGKKNESKMMPKGKKRPVKESVEQTLSFKQMVQLVQESGGQQQIDAVDRQLFNWAQRVAVTKLGEGMKAELYAGLIYERNGGRFEMYDVLSESKKKIVENRSRLDEGTMDKVKSLLMSKLAPKLSDQEKDKMADVAKQVLGKDRADKSDFTLANIKAVAKALGAKPETAAESIEEGPVGDFFGQKKKDPKSGRGTLGGIDAWAPSATLGEKLSSLTGILGGAAATIAGIFGGPAWLIIPGVLGIMFLSQIGMDRDGSS